MMMIPTLTLKNPSVILIQIQSLIRLALSLVSTPASISTKTTRVGELDLEHVIFLKRVYRFAVQGEADPIQRAIVSKRPRMEEEDDVEEQPPAKKTKSKSKDREPQKEHHKLSPEQFADVTRLYAAANLASGGTLEMVVKAQKNLLGIYTLFHKCFPVNTTETFTCCDSTFLRTNFQVLYNHFRIEHFAKVDLLHWSYSSLALRS